MIESMKGDTSLAVFYVVENCGFRAKNFFNY